MAKFPVTTLDAGVAADAARWNIDYYEPDDLEVSSITSFAVHAVADDDVIQFFIENPSLDGNPFESYIYAVLRKAVDERLCFLEPRWFEIVDHYRCEGAYQDSLDCLATFYKGLPRVVEATVAAFMYEYDKQLRKSLFDGFLPRGIAAHFNHNYRMEALQTLRLLTYFYKREKWKRTTSTSC